MQAKYLAPWQNADTQVRPTALFSVSIHQTLVPFTGFLSSAKVPWTIHAGTYREITVFLDSLGDALQELLPQCERPFNMKVLATLREYDVQKTFHFKPREWNQEFATFVIKWSKKNGGAPFSDLELAMTPVDQPHTPDFDIQRFYEMEGDASANPDPAINPLLSRELRFAPYLLWSDDRERNAIFTKYLNEKDSAFGRWNPTAFLVTYLQCCGPPIDAAADVEKIKERFALAVSILFPPPFPSLPGGRLYEIGYASETLPTFWNTQSWSNPEAIQALNLYRGDLYWAMNNYADPQAAMDAAARADAEQKVRLLDDALRNETKAFTGHLYRGSTYSWPETAVDTGERFTSATTNIHIAMLFALGRGTSMGNRVTPKQTDGLAPNVGGLQEILVTAATPMVRGNAGEGELIFPQHVRLKFQKYKLTIIDSHKLDDYDQYGLRKSLEDHPKLIFLTRVYHFIGLIEMSYKRARVQACISCAQPATHLCSGCEKAHFCSDVQCASHVEAHLDWCVKEKGST